MESEQEIEAAKERFHGSCNRVSRYIGLASGDEEMGRGLRLADAEVLADVYLEQQSQPIDETTAMPAFVGSDEIEIAGVVYVRKDLQPVNERLLNAAKQYLTVGNKPLSEIIELDEAIAAAEAEIAERRKPVTEERLKSIGGTADPCGNEHDDTHPIAFATVPPFKVDVLRQTWSIGFCSCDGFPTHGDVLDLLRVLGGAK